MVPVVLKMPIVDGYPSVPAAADYGFLLVLVKALTGFRLSCGKAKNAWPPPLHYTFSVGFGELGNDADRVTLTYLGDG